ncbi:MerR family transcriptional regulator [Knoellia remsis]|nr:MerR family transcriptional regulator [Knoellia remsis]
MTTTHHPSRETARMDELLTVGQVASTFGVTVRTLHHYDEIGLLSPSERSHAGYRLYTPEDLERLATIVTYRRLELPLDEVAALLRGEGSMREHLLRQRDAVMARVDELSALVDAIDTRLEREMHEQPATTEDLKEVFGDGFSDEYQAEAEQRWGDTDAWKQSSERTKRYTKADWEQVKTEQDEVNAAFVAALQSGEPATSEAAMDAAEQARLQIDRWFYDCSPEFHRNLGDLYVEDPRFTATYEEIAPGLAQYVRDAIHANADRAAGA